MPRLNDLKGSLLLAAILLLASWSGSALAGDDTACMDAIAAAEPGSPVPPGALRAIAVVESGRLIGTRLVPWPWSINANGVGRYYQDKGDAVAAVRGLQAAGVQSIDVGCMQINLMANPVAFTSLDQAFDPVVNVDYAARLLVSLFQRTGRWSSAMTSYHSRTPYLAAIYAGRLMAVWPGAAAIGLTAENGPARRPAAPAVQAPRSQLMLASAPIHGGAWPLSRR